MTPLSCSPTEMAALTDALLALWNVFLLCLFMVWAMSVNWPWWLDRWRVHRRRRRIQRIRQRRLVLAAAGQAWCSRCGYLNDHCRCAQGHLHGPHS